MAFNHNLTFLFVSDRLNKSIYFKQSNVTINTFNIKDKYCMMTNNKVVSVEYITQSNDDNNKVVKFAVKQLLNKIITLELFDIFFN